MPTISLREKIKQSVVLLDGAMGTQLFARGIEPGGCNEYLNITNPDIVCDVHKAYLEAGSDAILTNTFGANQISLSRHGLDGEVIAINKAAVELARQAAGADKFVLGDIGPTGAILEPLGQLTPQQCREAFIQQAEALLEAGVDGFIIETMTALDELTITVEAVKSVSDKLPVFASMSFDKGRKDFRTMMGVSIEAMVSAILPLGVDAIGFNCGIATLDEYVHLAGRFVSAVKAGSNHPVAVLAEPNAGKPQLVDGQAVYNISPEDFALAAEKIHSFGVGIIGGCCGTSPELIKAAAEKLK